MKQFLRGSKEKICNIHLNPIEILSYFKLFGNPPFFERLDFSRCGEINTPSVHHTEPQFPEDSEERKPLFLILTEKTMPSLSVSLINTPRDKHQEINTPSVRHTEPQFPEDSEERKPLFLILTEKTMPSLSVSLLTSQTQL